MRHTLCPISRYNYMEHLPLKYAEKIIKGLKEIKYKKELGFHNFSEPTIDPRLYYLMKLARKILPENPLVIWTNGKILTSNLVDDFNKIGNIKFVISVYDKETNDKIKSFNCNLVELNYWSEKTKMEENLLDIYSRSIVDIKKKCYAPYRQVIVNHKGEVSLCCYDWKFTVSFGNVKDCSLKEILTSKKMNKAYKELSSGKRVFDVCRRCVRER